MKKAIILYDGDCLFCNRGVQFIINGDTKAIFQFATLTGETGRNLREVYHVPSDIDSICLFQYGKSYIKSAAVLHICKGLGGWYKLLYIFIIIPRPIRDLVYYLVAKNRYKFSKQVVCRLPTEEERKRYLD
jgi:predicted DCC family thiol-disulfide oxidoreductase YuxK